MLANKKIHDPLDSLLESVESEQVNVETEHLKEMFRMIYSKDNIEVKTDLTPSQVLSITKLVTYGDMFGINVAHHIARVFMELSVSKNRLGRKEFTEISKATQAAQNEQPTVTERLFGGSRK